MGTLDATTGFGTILAENNAVVKVITINRTLTAAESTAIGSTGKVQMLDVPANFLLLGGTFTVDTAGTATCNGLIGIDGTTNGIMAATVNMDSEATTKLAGASIVASGMHFSATDTIDLTFDTAAPGALQYTLRLVGVDIHQNA